MQKLLGSMNDAFDAGYLRGTHIDGSAVDCPHDHSNLLLRLSWLNGFSEGRAISPERGRPRSGVIHR